MAGALVGLASRAISAAGKAVKQYARGSGSRKAADSFEKTKLRNEQRRAASQALRKKAEELDSIRSDMTATSKRLVKERNEATQRVTDAVGKAVKQGAMHGAPKTKQ